MITDIKHKHAGHVIIIEGQAFKANNAGQWDLTDIWRTLKLPVKNGPAQWRTKQAKRMEAMQNLHTSPLEQALRNISTRILYLKSYGYFPYRCFLA